MSETLTKRVYYSANNVGCKTPCACCGEPFKPSIGEEVPFDPETRMPVCWDCSDTREEVQDPFKTNPEGVAITTTELASAKKMKMTHLISELEAIGMKVAVRAGGSFLRGIVAVGAQKLIINAKPDSEPDVGRRKAPRFDIFMASFGGSSWRLSNLSVATVTSAIQQAETITQQQSKNALPDAELDRSTTQRGG